MSKRITYDYYKVLGVSREANAQEIRTAFRKLAKLSHPDKNGSLRAAALFTAIREAYHVLSDENRRHHYDKRLVYYREASTETGTRVNTRGKRSRETSDTSIATPSFAVLHVVGILFGALVGTRCLVGIIAGDWPAYTMLFSLPALLVLPDAVGGLWRAIKSWS